MTFDVGLRVLVLWLLAFGHYVKGHTSRQGGHVPPYVLAGSSARSLSPSWLPNYNVPVETDEDRFIRIQAEQNLGREADGDLDSTGEESFSPVENQCPPCRSCPRILPCQEPSLCPLPFCVPYYVPCPCGKKCCKRGSKCEKWNHW